MAILNKYPFVLVYKNYDEITSIQKLALEININTIIVAIPPEIVLDCGFGIAFKTKEDLKVMAIKLEKENCSLLEYDLDKKEMRNINYD